MSDEDYSDSSDDWFCPYIGRYEVPPAACCPIASVPREILGIVFEEVQSIYEEQLEYHNNGSAKKWEMDELQKPGLFVISQVCRTWYQVVHGTPALWTTVSVDASIWSEIKTIPSAALLRLVIRNLDRSGGLPISLYVKTGRNKKVAAKLLSACLAHHGRFQMLSVDICSLPSTYQLPTIGAFPVLERVTIYYSNGSPLIPIDRAPRLRSVELHDNYDSEYWHIYRIPFTEAVPVLPWNQITALESTAHISGAPLLTEILSRLPAAATADVCLGFPSFRRLASPVRISILTLKIGVHPEGGKRPDALGDVFASMTLPNIQSLEISCTAHRDHGRWSNAEWSLLAARSSFSTHLTSLSILVEISAQDLIATLESLPILETASIQELHPDIVLNDAVLRVLADTKALPKLTKVELRNTCVHFTDDALFALARSRTWQSNGIVVYVAREPVRQFTKEMEPSLGKLGVDVLHNRYC
ncbi:F-box domain-containing protein [Mycena kentingensis (nom. inval.)]|nr:F-box domain-containing protein [Mycena kentingensis (nom. inval.)]